MGKSSKLITAFKNRSRLTSVLRDYLIRLESPPEAMWGSPSKEEQDGLVSALARARDLEGPILEIGTLFGHTTQLLCLHKAPGQHVITIDDFSWNPFHMSPAEHREFTRASLRCAIASHDVSLIDNGTTEFYKSYNGTRPSMIFIDAGHDYQSVRDDIAWCLSRDIPIICGHDYSEQFPGVKRAVDDAFGGAIERHGTLWIADRRAPATRPHS